MDRRPLVMPFGRPSDVPANGPLVYAGVPIAGAPTGVPTAETPTVSTPSTVASDIARPSNPGGPGLAIDLTGNIPAGKQVFISNCVVCHAVNGVGDHSNPGSADGVIPPVNPIDSTLKSPDYTIFAYNLDLFIEHGSTPEGMNPTFRMPAWGDKGWLSPQQIADVIAFVISLNP